MRMRAFVTVQNKNETEKMEKEEKRTIEKNKQASIENKCYCLLNNSCNRTNKYDERNSAI